MRLQKCRNLELEHKPPTSALLGSGHELQLRSQCSRTISIAICVGGIDSTGNVFELDGKAYNESVV